VFLAAFPNLIPLVFYNILNPKISVMEALDSFHSKEGRKLRFRWLALKVLLGSLSIPSAYLNVLLSELPQTYTS